MARRIDEQVPLWARGKVRVRAERGPGIEAATPHAVGKLLRKNIAWRPPLFGFAADGRGRTDEYRSPRRQPLLLCARLPCEHAFAVLFHNQIGRDVPSCAAIYASRVDVPVARSGVGITNCFH